MKRNHSLALAICLVATIWASDAAAGSRPVVTVDTAKKQIIASELTPGTQVLIYGYGAGTTGYDRVFSEWHEIVSDSDNDGIVTYKSNEPIPWRSIWVAVDLRNAQFGIAAPAGYNIAVPTTTKVFKRDAAGLLTQLASASPWLNAVYVHPGGGVWLMTADDGQPDDFDGRPDGFTTLALQSFKSLGVPGERPKEFVPGGVLIVIDPFRMQLYAVRLDGSILKGGGQ